MSIEAKINADELKILVWLHEHALGCGESARIDVDAIERDLGMDRYAIAKPASFLMGWGLVGGSIAETQRNDGSARPWLTELYLTSLGENYVRVMESRPGIATRLTLGVLSKLGEVAIDVGSSVLAQVIDARLRGSAA